MQYKKLFLGYWFYRLFSW